MILQNLRLLWQALMRPTLNYPFKAEHRIVRFQISQFKWKINFVSMKRLWKFVNFNFTFFERVLFIRKSIFVGKKSRSRVNTFINYASIIRSRMAGKPFSCQKQNFLHSLNHHKKNVSLDAQFLFFQFLRGWKGNAQLNSHCTRN